MRMSGLCKVEMSAFMDGRGAHGNGANHFEPTRTGPIESVARGTAAASNAGCGSRAAESNRPPGAPDAAPHPRTGGWWSGSRITRPAIESQAGSPLRGEGFDSRGSALCRLRAHAGRRTLSQGWFPVSRETLRTWMSKAAFWHPRSQRVKKIHVWRERRASFGELVMQDSSPFRWLEDRGPACQLIAVIDDATSRIHARFTEHDTTEENLRTFGGWVRRYGRPLAHYTDKNSIFRKAGPQPLPEQLRGDPLRTQFGRALSELGIEWIAAHSPQAKGR